MNPDWKSIVYGKGDERLVLQGANVVFKGELKRGKDHDEAFAHTSAFLSALL